MISVDKIRIENIRSFIGVHDINFSKQPGLKLMSGRNEVEPRLGGNGAGKSSLWDALTFCFYGSGVRGQRAADLASWGSAGPSVDVSVTVQGTQHQIRRQGSPNRLEVNAVAAEQHEVDRLLGLTRDRFLQAVVFGQAAPLFLDLTSAQRSALLDTVLDLSVWLNASEIASKKVTTLDKEVTGVEQQLAHEEGRQAELDTKHLEAACAAWETEHAARIETVLQILEQAEAEFAETTDPLDYIDIDTAALSEAILELQDVYADLRHSEKAVRFYRDHTDCPSCGQPISEHLRQQKIAELSAGHDLPSLKAAIDEKQAALLAVQRDNATGAETIRSQREHRRMLTGQIQRATRQAEFLSDQENPFKQQLADATERKKTLRAAISALQGKRNHIKGQRDLAEYWKAGFRKVRLYQVQQILARMELEVQNAAATLGIAGWKIKFVTETANKSGTMRPGIQVLVDSPHHVGPWETMSGGEAQRLRLAVALGMSSLIQNFAGVDWRIEVWDEPTNWLAPEGIEDLLGALATRANITGKSIWVLDHRALTYAGFAEVWTTVKTVEGSRIELTTQMN